jgi:uncharacterized membrane protein YphA (DoxX/SURF4 family)
MTENRSRWRIATLWVVSTVLGFVFLLSGGSKLAGAEMQVEMFGRLGLPDWSLPTVGVIEFVSAILILLPATRAMGAASIVVIMVGAALTHLVTGVIMQMVLVNIIVGIPAALVAWVKRDQFAALAGQPREPRKAPDEAHESAKG